MVSTHSTLIIGIQLKHTQFVNIIRDKYQAECAHFQNSPEYFISDSHGNYNIPESPELSVCKSYMYADNNLMIPNTNYKLYATFDSESNLLRSYIMVSFIRIISDNGGEEENLHKKLDMPSKSEIINLNKFVKSDEYKKYNIKYKCKVHLDVTYTY